MSTETQLVDVKPGKNIPIPKKNYALRCTEEEVRESKSGNGNMMVYRKWEILDPTEVPWNGKNLVLAGTEMEQRIVFLIKSPDGSINEKSTAWAQSMLKEDYIKLGFDVSKIDFNNPLATVSAKGLIADAICNSKEYTQCEDLTADERAAGAKQGKPILDRNTNKPLKGFQANIQEILGVSSFKPTNPY